MSRWQLLQRSDQLESWGRSGSAVALILKTPSAVSRPWDTVCSTMAVDSSPLTLVIPHGQVPLRIMSLEQVGNTKRHPLRNYNMVWPGNRNSDDVLSVNMERFGLRHRLVTVSITGFQQTMERTGFR